MFRKSNRASRALGIMPIALIASMLLTACGGTAATNTAIPPTEVPTAMTLIETPTAMVAGETPTAMMVGETPTAMTGTETPGIGSTPVMTGTPGAMMTPGLSVRSTTVTMKAQNGSGEDGTGTITDMGNGMFEVTLNLSNGTTDPQPAHIHNGSCANLDPNPLVPLQNVVNGTSTSQITTTMTMSDLFSTPHAINVHKSTTDVSTYVSCGDIVPATTGTETPGAVMETPVMTGTTPPQPHNSYIALA